MAYPARGNVIKSTSPSGAFTGLVDQNGNKLGIGYLASQSGFPMILPSSGSVANNGAVTLTTALPATFAFCYMFFQANAISAGSAAGMYYTIMASTTVGQVFNNVYTTGDPVIIASPTPFVTTGPGAYTQVLTEITMRSISIAGGSIGNNGRLRVLSYWGTQNSATTKTMKHNFGTYAIINAGLTTSSSARYEGGASSLGNQALLTGPISNTGSAIVPSASGGTITPIAIDHSVTQNFVSTATLTAATDYIISSAVSLEILPA